MKYYEDAKETIEEYKRISGIIEKHQEDIKLIKEKFSKWLHVNKAEKLSVIDSEGLTWDISEQTRKSKSYDFKEIERLIGIVKLEELTSIKTSEPFISIRQIVNKKSKFKKDSPVGELNE